MLVYGNGKRTRLMHSCKVGDLDRITVLLGAGANVNAIDKSGRTALEYAATGGHAAVLDLLLARGADVKPTLTRREDPGHNTSGVPWYERRCELVCLGFSTATLTQLCCASAAPRVAALIAALDGSLSAVVPAVMGEGIMLWKEDVEKQDLMHYLTMPHGFLARGNANSPGAQSNSLSLSLTHSLSRTHRQYWSPMHNNQYSSSSR